MIPITKNNAPFSFQKYAKGRFVLDSLFQMDDNYIVPLISEAFNTISGLTISSQKLYKYDEFKLSKYKAGDDITAIRTEISSLSLNFSIQTLGNYSKWYTSGDTVTNIANGYYSIEWIDSSGQIFTTYPFKVCEETATAETFYIIFDETTIFSPDGIDTIIHTT